MAGEFGGPVTAREMAVIEENALALGLSFDALMENAGRAIAEETAAHLPPPPGRIAVLVGTGNNGGDGSGAAFYLGQWGYVLELWLVRPPSEVRSASARRCWDRAAAHFRTHFGAPTASALRGFDLAVDALLGSGQAGALRSPYRESVDALTESGVPVLSVDVPTGLGTPNAVHPRWTVALTAPKVGMTEENSGAITVRDIGIPPEARRRTGPGEYLLFPTAASRGSRGRSGRVLVVGGGPYSGAPALAALAALRSGAERATVVAPAPAAGHVQQFSPNLVVVPTGSGHLRPVDVHDILATLERAPVRALLLGMGAGSHPETIEAMREVLRAVRGQLPIVVDADALRALEPVGDGPAGAVVATPNEGEYERLFGPDPATRPEERLQTARQRAADWGVTFVVKGEADLLTDGHSAHLNLHHHSAMTVAGAGDVLAGVVGSLLAQGLTPIEAARLGAHWVSDAGHAVAEVRGFGLVATDLLDALPAALVAGLRRVGVPP